MSFLPFVSNLGPIVDAAEEARRRNRLQVLLVGAAAFVLFLMFRKRAK